MLIPDQVCSKFYPHNSARSKESICISFRDTNLIRTKTRKTDIYDLISAIYRRKIILQANIKEKSMDQNRALSVSMIGFKHEVDWFLDYHIPVLKKSWQFQAEKNSCSCISMTWKASQWSKELKRCRFMSTNIELRWNGPSHVKWALGTEKELLIPHSFLNKEISNFILLYSGHWVCDSQEMIFQWVKESHQLYKSIHVSSASRLTTAEISFNGFFAPRNGISKSISSRNPDKIQSNVNPTAQGRIRTLTVSCLCLTTCQTIMAA